MKRMVRFLGGLYTSGAESCSYLQRLAALVGVAMVIASLWGTPASAQVDRPFLALKQIHWATSTGGVIVDSTLKALNGAPATNNTIDTTQVVDTADWDWNAFVAGPTASGIAKLWVVSNSGAVANVDTVLVAVDSSPDQVHWQNVKASTLMTFATANDLLCSLPLVQDTDAATGDPALGRYLRFRVRSDASATATFPNAAFYIAYLKLQSSR